ncbi:MAG: 2-iminoacetate synthase ThiH [Candidatus Aminicenantes bacterium]|nr:MAG: 2-iminoacetate synthase ThiH [Candidatus Aminicenantes bacterium]
MISFEELKGILDNNDKQFIESLAQKARATTIQYFGRAISIYAPLYLSNFCENYCVYCGFNRTMKVERKKLTLEEMHQEMKKISQSGIQNILLLTGESRSMTPVDYIKTAVTAAKDYFPGISLEVYPLEVDEYKELFEAGVDGVTIYQETYNKKRYKMLHQAGKKTDFHYRYETPERMAKSGIRMINMGVLLGLSEVAEDVYQLFLHLERMEKKYPGVEYALSFPRLIPLKESEIDYFEVPDITLIKLICTARILFPRVGINLSTRERPYIRDHALPLGVTKISAASKTSVGGYCVEENKDPQFEVMDKRSVTEIVGTLDQKGFDPVFTDWRRITNEAV